MTEKTTLLPMSKKEVAAQLGVSEHTLRVWIGLMLDTDEKKQEFGEYRARKYTAKQLRMIFIHVGHDY